MGLAVQTEAFKLSSHTETCISSQLGHKQLQVQLKYLSNLRKIS